VQALFVLCKTETKKKRKKIATWNATMNVRKEASVAILGLFRHMTDSGILESRRCTATRSYRPNSRPGNNNKEDEEIGNRRAFVKDCEHQRLNSDGEKDKHKTRRSANQKTTVKKIPRTWPRHMMVQRPTPTIARHVG
jgi:hypothetical protein